MGVLVEHYAGAFPPWLAPVQVQGIPIAERHNDYLFDVAEKLKAAGVRVEVDISDDRMQKKIRNAQLQKVPFMVIAGDSDVERSEEHTSELQSLMRSSYAVFCLKQKTRRMTKA